MKMPKMKLPDKKILAALLGTVALTLYSYFSSDAEVAQPVLRKQHSAPLIPAKSTAQSTRKATGNSTTVSATDPSTAISIHALQTREADEKKTGALFAGKTQLAKAVAKPPPPPPPPAPVAPPLPFSYLGSQTSGGKIRVYLARGDEVFIVSEGSVIARDYQLKSIEPQSLTLVYLPLGQVQQLSTGATN